MLIGESSTVGASEVGRIAREIEQLAEVGRRVGIGRAASRVLHGELDLASGLGDGDLHLFEACPVVRGHQEQPEHEVVFGGVAGNRERPSARGPERDAGAVPDYLRLLATAPEERVQINIKDITGEIRLPTQEIPVLGDGQADPDGAPGTV